MYFISSMGKAKLPCQVTSALVSFIVSMDWKIHEGICFHFHSLCIRCQKKFASKLHIQKETSLLKIVINLKNSKILSVWNRKKITNFDLRIYSQDYLLLKKISSINLIEDRSLSSINYTTLLFECNSIKVTAKLLCPHYVYTYIR